MRQHQIDEDHARACCCGPPYHERDNEHGKRFLTKTEKAEKLKSYAEMLRKELAAVEEHIKEYSS